MTVAVKERPILFSGPMVRAILDGRKTQTRRVIKPQPVLFPEWLKYARWIDDGFNTPCFHVFGDSGMAGEWMAKCPYGKLGDRLWVRESFFYSLEDPGSILYKDPGGEWEFKSTGQIQGKPSIHMPRWASRILLEITDIRVERLQDISEADARAEGVDPPNLPLDVPIEPGDYVAGAKTSFAILWNSINATRGCGWDTNPWVWVVDFKQANTLSSLGRE